MAASAVNGLAGPTGAVFTDHVPSVWPSWGGLSVDLEAPARAGVCVFRVLVECVECGQVSLAQGERGLVFQAPKRAVQAGIGGGGFHLGWSPPALPP